MASIRTFTLPHYAAYPVHVALFHHVQNPAFLKSQLVAGNPDFDYAFLDASMILSPAHLLAAAFHALHALDTHRPKTRSPHSELVFRLSPNNNIAQSYSLFGITDTTTAIVVVKLGCRATTRETAAGTQFGIQADERVTAQSVGEHLARVVQGVSVVLGERGEGLGDGCDVARVRGVYKLGGGGGNKAGKKAGVGVAGRQESHVENAKGLETVVLGMLSLKGS